MIYFTASLCEALKIEEQERLLYSEQELEYMSSSKHILIIDDDKLTRRLFGGKLAIEGFDILYAEDGNEGREIARRLQPDLILLDIRMPDEDGCTVAKRLEEERRTKNIPIIFLTNEDISKEAEKALKEVWAKDYIHKSTDLNEMVERVRKVIQVSKKEKQPDKK